MKRKNSAISGERLNALEYETGLKKIVLSEILDPTSEVNTKCPIITRQLNPIKPTGNKEEDLRLLAEANKDIGSEIVCIGCPWRINADEYLNCSLVAFAASPAMDFNRIATVMSLSEQAVVKIYSPLIDDIKITLEHEKNFKTLEDEFTIPPEDEEDKIIDKLDRERSRRG